MNCLLGPPGQGKSTMLKILGGVILPPDPDADSSFVPAHLRVLHISLQPMFARDTLMKNLIYGVSKVEDSDASPERVLAICRRTGLQDPRIFKHLESDEIHDWAEIFSHTQLSLLNIARAVVANPEIMCVHKPTLNFDEVLGKQILELFQEFVAKKGILQDQSMIHLRRPRTCVLTAADCRLSVEMCDTVWLVSSAGVKKISSEDMWEELRKVHLVERPPSSTASSPAAPDVEVPQATLTVEPRPVAALGRASADSVGGQSSPASRATESEIAVVDGISALGDPELGTKSTDMRATPADAYELIAHMASDTSSKAHDDTGAHAAGAESDVAVASKVAVQAEGTGTTHAAGAESAPVVAFCEISSAGMDVTETLAEFAAESEASVDEVASAAPPATAAEAPIDMQKRPPSSCATPPSGPVAEAPEATIDVAVCNDVLAPPEEAPGAAVTGSEGAAVLVHMEVQGTAGTERETSP
eukprot:gnl/TRDRNA2_/TRDRNA2_162652_c4_seq6.p1 gnl/TRDRNA2_/TRDRNA2_162652_c4~~gnl/TRDRNA2_/TRDRNA2_162652_c4_seq6.p1  ORF type:complete len:473 (+),score=84.71 gnl/TRDRNA2_/TRDRNA2_162652_c4_seq6:103-1521(+)